MKQHQPGLFTQMGNELHSYNHWTKLLHAAHIVLAAALLLYRTKMKQRTAHR
ncbi:hypothetical protein HYZ97_00760 [Candidatus Pacearchaeota archaeon]|nr:hypothetical protein [Candidatus Pacearchaeota archaeon]